MAFLPTSSCGPWSSGWRGQLRRSSSFRSGPATARPGTSEELALDIPLQGPPADATAEPRAQFLQSRQQRHRRWTGSPRPRGRAGGSRQGVACCRWSTRPATTGWSVSRLRVRIVDEPLFGHVQRRAGEGGPQKSAGVWLGGTGMSPWICGAACVLAALQGPHPPTACAQQPGRLMAGTGRWGTDSERTSSVTSAVRRSRASPETRQPGGTQDRCACRPVRHEWAPGRPIAGVRAVRARSGGGLLHSSQGRGSSGACARASPAGAGIRPPRSGRCGAARRPGTRWASGTGSR